MINAKYPPYSKCSVNHLYKNKIKIFGLPVIASAFLLANAFFSFADK